MRFKILKFISIIISYFAMLNFGSQTLSLAPASASTPAQSGKNFKQIYMVLERCAAELNGKDLIDSRSLLSQLRAGVKTRFCDETAFENSVRGIQAVTNQIDNDLDEVALFRGAQSLALDKTLKSLIKYELQFLDGRAQTKSQRTNILKSICPRGACTKDVQRFYFNEIKRYSKKLHIEIGQSKVASYSLESAVALLNGRIANLQNQQVAVAHNIQALGRKSSEVQSSYDLYTMKYFNDLSDTLGSLLSTDTLKGRTRSLSQLNDFENRGGRAFSSVTYPAHKKIRTKCRQRNVNQRDKKCAEVYTAEYVVAQALAEVKGRLTDYAQKVHDSVNLKELLKSSPVAVGQALVENPNMANRVCQLSQEIAQTDEFIQKGFAAADGVITVLDTVSLAALASGVGAAGGAALKGGGLALRGGVKVGRALLLNAAGPYLGWAGKAAIAGGALRSFSGSAGLTHSAFERDSLLGARLAESQSSSEYRRAVRLDQEFQASLKKLGLGSFQLATGTGLLAKFRATGKLSELLKFKGQIKFSDKLLADQKFSQAMDLVVSRNPNAINQLNFIAVKSGLGSEQMSAFILSLATRTESQILAVLERLTRANANPVQFVNLVQNLRAKLKKGCGL